MKQLIFEEKICSVFFAILLATLAWKFRKDSSLLAMTWLTRIPRPVPSRIVADFQKYFRMELSEKGLFRTHERSREVQEALRQRYPNEHHVDCHLWAIFRCQ